MVDDMIVDNVVEEETAAPAKAAVNGGCCPLEEGPRLGFELWQIWVGVMEVCDGDDPMIDPHVRHNVETSYHSPANLVARV